MDIHFDTSSLVNLLSTDKTWHSFIEFVIAKDVRIIISPLVFIELFSWEDQSGIRSRGTKLAKLWDAAKLKFYISDTIRDIIREELDHILTLTPTLSANKRRSMRSWLINDRSPLFEPTKRQAIIQEVTDSKDLGIRMDQGIAVLPEKRKLLADEDRRRKALDFMKSYCGPQDDFGWCLEGLFQDKTILSSKGINMAAIRNSDRYRAARTFLAHTELQMYGAILAEYYSDSLVRSFKAVRGNWVDAAIMASAAYAQLFVVDDEAAFARADFLSKRGIVQFRTVTSLSWSASAI